jgi:uncharacterized protein YbjT (DUF2867 family)
MISEKPATLVAGGTGKTGRRVTDHLRDRHLPVRIGSRAGQPPLDWADPGTWPAALRGMQAVYIAYYPDVATPGAAEQVRAFSAEAVRQGVRRIVLLSGRGEDLAQESEQAVCDSGADWTILQANWFSQNFSESFLRDPILNGEVLLPVGDVGEPFVDVDDLAAVAVEALTDPAHAGQIYTLSGPRPLTFAQAVAEIGQATGRALTYTPVPLDSYAAGLTAQGVPADMVALMRYLFGTVLDGRNSAPTDDVARVLGRPPRDFSHYVREAAAAGAFTPVTAQA